MEKEELLEKIGHCLVMAIRVEKEAMENSKECSKIEYKNGIYCFYNKDNKIIYIGKVGSGLRTSLYHRVWCHGSGSHKNKSWYNEVAYGRFWKIDKIEKSDLARIERLAISHFKPCYNDNLDLSAETIKRLEEIVNQQNAH